MSPTLTQREFLETLSEEQLVEISAAKDSGDLETMNSLLIDANRANGMTDQQQIEAAGEHVQTPQEYYQEVNKGMETAASVAAPIALSVLGGAAGGMGAAALGAGRIGVAGGALAGDVALNYANDAARTRSFGGEAAKNAAINAALSGISMGVGGAVRAIMPSQRAGLLKQAAVPGGISGEFATKGGSQTSFANIEQLKSVEDDLVSRNFYSKIGGDHTNSVNLETLKMEVSPNEAAIPAAMRQNNYLDQSIRASPAVIKAAATSPEALRPLVQARDAFVDSLDAAYESVRVNGGLPPIRGVQAEDLFSSELQEKMARWNVSSFTRAKAILANDTQQEVLKDFAAVNKDNAESIYGWVQFVTDNVKETKSGKVTVTLNKLGELSPKQAQMLYRNAQEFLRDAGQYDLSNLAKVLGGNRASLVPAVELSQEVAKDIVSNLGREISSLEARTRAVVSSEGWLFPDIAQQILTKPQDYIANANQIYHSLSTAHRTMSREAARVAGIVEGGAINNNPAISMMQQTFGAVSEQIYPQGQRRIAASKDAFNRAALLADARLNPDRYAAGGMTNIFKAAFASATPEVANFARELVIRANTPPMDPLTRSTSDVFKDPKGSADKIYNFYAAQGQPNLGVQEASAVLMIVGDRNISYGQKKSIIADIIRRSAPPTKEGFSGVVDGAHSDPAEAREQIMSGLDGTITLSEEAKMISGALSGKYVESKPGQSAPVIMPPIMRPKTPINMSHIEGAFQASPEATNNALVPESNISKMQRLSAGTDREAY